MSDIVDRLEDDDGAWILAEHIMRLVAMSGLTERQAIGALFSALGATMAIAGWTVEQARAFLDKSVTVSFGTTGSMTAGAAAADDAKGRS